VMLTAGLVVSTAQDQAVDPAVGLVEDLAMGPPVRPEAALVVGRALTLAVILAVSLDLA
jgi:hypothetical protein